MALNQSPEFRAQEIKTRRLEIAATLAEWRRAFFVDGVERPFSERVKLEAEAANLALEARVIGAEVEAAKIERRKLVNDSLLTKVLAVNAELLDALEGVVRVADRATDEFDAARSAITKAKQLNGAKE